MATPDLASDLVNDLLRASWLVEAARARIFGDWGKADAASGAERRAALVAEALAGQPKGKDEGLLDPHVAWMRSLVGNDPAKTPLADWFLSRLADWVDGHAGGFLAPSVAEEMAFLGMSEKEGLEWPGELPAAPPFEPLDLPRLETPDGKIFRFGILGDLHIGHPRGEKMARAAIADLNKADVDLVIQLGDITDHGHRSEFELAAQILGDLEPELFTMMGNHDVLSIEEERLSGRDYYPTSFGRAPDGVLHEHKGIRFAILDSAEYSASPFSPFDIVAGSFVGGPGGAIVRGSLTPPQHEILAEVAAPGSPPAFVFLHHPPQPFTGFPPVLFGLREADAGRLHAVIDSGNVWGVFAGHTHRNARTRTYGTVPAQEVGIARDYPFGFATVDVGDNGYAYNWQQLSDNELLEESYKLAGTILRRYGAGPDGITSFTWSR